MLRQIPVVKRNATEQRWHSLSRVELGLYTCKTVTDFKTSWQHSGASGCTHWKYCTGPGPTVSNARKTLTQLQRLGRTSCRQRNPISCDSHTLQWQKHFSQAVITWSYFISNRSPPPPCPSSSPVMGIFQQINVLYLHDFSSYYNLGFKRIVILYRKERDKKSSVLIIFTTYD